MQVISSHKLVDVIRVENGLILEIIKYEPQKGWVWIPDCKKHLKKLSGVKNGYVVKSDFEYSGNEFKTGEFIIDHFRATPLEDKDLFRVEIRCAGGSIRRSIKHMNILLKDIMNYINENY